MSGRNSGSESDTGSIEYGIPGPSADLNIPASIQAAAAKLAPVAGAAAANAPVQTIVQFDQKKTPAFYGRKDTDALTLNEWIRRIDGMRKSLGWNAATTFHNARAALFADAANHIEVQANPRIDDSFAETWDWMQKSLKAQFGDCTTSREYVDIIFNMKPAPGLHVSLPNHSNVIYQNFNKIREAIPKPTYPDLPAAGHFNMDELKEAVDAETHRIIDAFAYAFIVNLQPPTVRTKVLDKNPGTIREALQTINLVQKALLDEKRPLHAPMATSPVAVPQAISMLSNNPGIDTTNPMAPFLIAALEENNKLKKAQVAAQNGPTGGQGGGRNRRRRNNQNNQQSGNQSGGNSSNGSNAPKTCSYCQKKGHGQIDCFKRKNDKAPCINVRGEPFYPQGEETGRTNVSQAQVREGSDFQNWV